jgi:hypothetical protein
MAKRLPVGPETALPAASRRPTDSVTDQAGLRSRTTNPLAAAAPDGQSDGHFETVLLGDRLERPDCPAYVVGLHKLPRSTGARSVILPNIFNDVA